MADTTTFFILHIQHWYGPFHVRYRFYGDHSRFTHRIHEGIISRFPVTADTAAFVAPLIQCHNLKRDLPER